MTSPSSTAAAPSATPELDLRRVGVVGFGAMGAGIAQVLAASGRQVRVVEADASRLAHGRERVRTSLSGAVERGKLSAEQAAAALDAIAGTTDPTDLSDVDLVVEAVSEDLAVKREALGAAAAVVGGDVPIVTNTSALSVTELAAGLHRPERVAGLHFFNPVPAMHVVEVVAGMQTDQALVSRLTDFVESLPGKQAIVVDDRPGFLVNALLLPYLNDVIQEYDDGLATARDIDVALELGLGYRTGPLAMLDLIGLDVHLHATEALHAATGDRRYAPPPLLRRLVAAGRLGDKSGSGFRTGAQATAGATPIDDRTTT